MIRASLLTAVALAGCFQLDTETDRSDVSDPWTGTIQIDGTGISFIGHDPISASVALDTVAAVGWIELPGRPAALAYVELRFENLAAFGAERPDTLAVADRFESGEAGAALSYIELGAPGFRQVASEGHGGTTTGSLDIDDTDWTTTLEARLDATLTAASGSRRELALSVRWVGPKQ